MSGPERENGPEEEREDGAPGGDAAAAGEFVLGLLPEAERAAFEARLRADPALRGLVRAWEESLAGMADEIAPVPPPARVRRALEGRLFEPRPSLGARLLGALLGAGSALLALATAAVVALALWPDRLALPPVGPAVEIASEDRSLVIAARLDPEAGTLRVERLAGAAPPGRALELWLIAGEAAPVSLGVLPQDARAEIAVGPALAPLLPGAVLAVSDEPIGGSPTGAPTGAVLATGAVPVA